MSPALPMNGHEEAEKTFLSARSTGRLHHGWIVRGPSGIGKSLFVRRLASVMLGASSPDAPDTDAVMQKVLSGSHPDLYWLQRELNEKGQLRQDITVEQVRGLTHFFTLKPAMSGWRIGVIDALDEMNVSGMNALLKTLEEPPVNAILFLVSHDTRTILPTIKSRCRVLRLKPLSKKDTEQVLTAQGSSTPLATELAGGRPGYGLKLSTASGAKAGQAIRAVLKSIHKPSPAAVAEALTAAGQDDVALAAFADELARWTAAMAENDPELAEAWLALQRTRATGEELNLTPPQLAAKMLAIVQDAVRSTTGAT